MESHMRAVPEVAEEATLAEQAPSFEEFYGANFRHVFTALCLVTGNRHEAEEITQDSFLKIYERWDRVGALDDPTAYLFRVSMNTFRNRYRRALLGLRRELLLAPEATDELAEIESHDEVVRLRWAFRQSNALRSSPPRSLSIRPTRRGRCSACVPPRSAPLPRAPAPR